MRVSCGKIQLDVHEWDGDLKSAADFVFAHDSEASLTSYTGALKLRDGRGDIFIPRGSYIAIGRRGVMFRLDSIAHYKREE